MTVGLDIFLMNTTSIINIVNINMGLFIICMYRMSVIFFPASRYGAVLLPSSPGALHDLAKDNELAKLLNAFVQDKSGY